MKIKYNSPMTTKEKLSMAAEVTVYAAGLCFLGMAINKFATPGDTRIITSLEVNTIFASELLKSMEFSKIIQGCTHSVQAIGLGIAAQLPRMIRRDERAKRLEKVIN